MWAALMSKMKLLNQVTVEPVMFLDGACHWSMQVFMEIVQMNKICSVSLGFSDEICANLSAYPDERIQVQREFSTFVFQNSIIMSILPLVFVLFMGSWSDKYGRKIPLMMTTVCHVMWSGGYLLNSWQASWPMEFIYLVTFFDSLGGGPQGLVSTSVAYISDVTPIKTRTGRVSTAMSLWYFGGPLGNLIGALAIQYGGIDLALGIVFAVHMSIMCYITFYIKESHGPFAVIGPVDNDPRNSCTMKKEEITKTKMILDFFNWRRVAEAFKTAFRRREGNDRAILVTVIFSNMIRRAARGFLMYAFVQVALKWEAATYSYWTSYRTMIAATGSLVLVPILSRLISITDAMLVVIGSLSLIGEYCCYGFVREGTTAFLMWMGPLAGLISNASIIAQKSMATKLVSSTEKGRVSAVMSATQSLMPMVGYAMFSPIYRMTVETFPEAQFFFAASLVVIILVTFLAIHLSSIVRERKRADLEKEITKGKLPESDKKPNVGPLSDQKENSSPSPPEESGNDPARSGTQEKIGQLCTKRPSGHMRRARPLSEPANLLTRREAKEQMAYYENKVTDEEILESEKNDNKSLEVECDKRR